MHPSSLDCMHECAIPGRNTTDRKYSKCFKLISLVYWTFLKLETSACLNVVNEWTHVYWVATEENIRHFPIPKIADRKGFQGELQGQSTDLNHTEKLWAILKNEVYASPYFKTIEELITLGRTYPKKHQPDFDYYWADRISKVGDIPGTIIENKRTPKMHQKNYQHKPKISQRRIMNKYS